MCLVMLVFIESNLSGSCGRRSHGAEDELS